VTLIAQLLLEAFIAHLVESPGARVREVLISACVADGWLNESLLGSDRHVDPIVLRSEQWFNGKHFFFREPHEIDRRIIVPFQQLFAASQMGDADGFRQLLCTTSLEALELKITVNDPMDTGTVNASFT